MPVRIDKPGQHRQSTTIMAEIKLLWGLFLTGQKLADLALFIDEDGRKTDNLAILVERDAIDILDKSVGNGRGSECGEGCSRQKLKSSHRLGNLRTSALVSCRPPPIYWMSE